MTTSTVFLWGIPILMLSVLVLIFGIVTVKRLPFSFSSSSSSSSFSLPKQKRKKEEESRGKKEIIYALMVTGKNDERISMASDAIVQFRAQTYPHKKMIILNHHQRLAVLPAVTKEENNEKNMHCADDDVCEIRVDKEARGLTLGHLRNILLELVPLDALWTVWDDDDWRHPDYLAYLENTRKQNHVEAVAITQRYEYNARTRFTWKIRVKKGLPFVLCRSHPSLRYMSRDSMEDVRLSRDIRERFGDIHLAKNDPQLYIRLVHGDNTSTYVDAKKNMLASTERNVNYFEYDVSASEERYVLDRIKYLYDANVDY